MKSQTLEAFSDFIYGDDGDVYSPTELNDVLGRYDQLAVQLIADQADSGSATLAAKLEESTDGRNWSERAGGLTAQTLSATATKVFSFADSGTRPFMAYVRLKLTINAGHDANVKAYACGRDNG